MNPLPPDILADAKDRTEACARRGLLLTPREAWLLSGETKTAQTLWSIAFHLSIQHEVSAEDLNEWLEATFPEYAKNVEPPRAVEPEEE